MSARVLVIVALTVGCAGLQGHRWTEDVTLISQSTGPEIVV
jgi:hypothetical protein